MIIKKYIVVELSHYFSLSENNRLKSTSKEFISQKLSLC